MQITRRSAALKLKAQRNLQVGVFDHSKMEWEGSESTYLGRTVPDIDGVVAVYVERRSDAHGPYAILRSIKE